MTNIRDTVAVVHTTGLGGQYKAPRPCLPTCVPELAILSRGTPWIVHRPTGYRIARCRSIDHAGEVARAIADLADWSAQTPRALEASADREAIVAAKIRALNSPPFVSNLEEG